MVNIVLDLWFCVPCATYDGRCVAEIKGSKLVLNRNVKATLLLLHLLTWTLVFIHALYWLNMVKPLFLLAKPPPKKKTRVFLALFGASQPRSWLLWERQIKPSRRVSAKKGASRRTLSAMFGWNLAAMM